MNPLRKDPVHMLALAGMMTALTCIATMIIHIPSPANGFVNLGDGFVILSGLLLGPLFGAAAAGIGSMLADLLLSYAHYAPATLLIKGLAALAASLIYRALAGKCKETPATAFAGTGSLIIVTAGYFLYSSQFLGKGAAALSSVPGDLFQGALGIVTAVLLAPLFRRILSQTGW